MQSESEGSREKVVRGKSSWDMKEGVLEEATCVLQAVSVLVTLCTVSEDWFTSLAGMVGHLWLTG